MEDEALWSNMYLLYVPEIGKRDNEKAVITQGIL